MSCCNEACQDCQSTCQLAGCQSSCQLGCQSSCETHCQSSCERKCEFSCLSCQNCEGRCETTCENSAQNAAPYSPSKINLPDVLRGGEIAYINWAATSDKDNNLSGYILEKSEDNGPYKQIYRGSNTSYNDSITKGIKTVRYRVKAYDSQGAESGYTFSSITKVENNSAPKISGSDLNLGSRQEDFNISYVITDSDPEDMVTETVEIDDRVLVKDSPITLGVQKTIKIAISDYSLGEHKIKIIAKDKEGSISKRVYTFNKVNSAPIISGQDADLGNKNSAFTIVYTVKDPNNDKVNVVEKINNKVIRSVTNIGTSEQSITVTAEMLSQFAINEANTIEIEARDNNSAVSYRRFTFKRSNFAPVISGADGDIGRRDKELSYTYSATDEEKDAIKMKVFLDDTLVVPEFDAEDNKEYVYELKGFEFLKLPFGKHTLKIVATDSNGLSSARLVSFNRVAQKLVMQLKDPRDTDVAAKKVLVIPGWFVAPGAKARVEVCNNAYDSNPTWEDATAVTNEGRAFNFLNTSKTATKWGVNIRLTIEKGTSTVYSYITTIGGSVE